MKFITEQDAVAITELRKKLAITGENIENGEVQDLSIDPNFVKYNGSITPFVKVDDYIITAYELEAPEIDLIKWYFDGAPDSTNIEFTWAVWNNAQNGVAYRGGCGYSYDIAVK